MYVAGVDSGVVGISSRPALHVQLHCSCFLRARRTKEHGRWVLDTSEALHGYLESALPVLAHRPCVLQAPDEQFPGETSGHLSQGDK